MIMKAPPELLRRLPDPGELVQQLQDAPEDLISRAFPAEDPGLRVRRGLAPGEGLESFPMPEPEDIDPTVSILREPWLEAGTRAVEKIHADGELAELDPEELGGLEAIVLLTGRPAILIHGGTFFLPPANWMHLEDAREEIEAACRSVGRIEVDGHWSYDWVGTGFLVADDVVMTNRHVAEVFCQMRDGQNWQFKSGMAGRIDYVEEIGATDSAEFALESVIGIHETLDMAVFRVSRTSSSGVEPPEPLAVASQFPQAGQGHQVYAVGYPAWDGRRNDPAPMLEIFRNIFNVKRLQPGEMTDLLESQHLFKHDCSTLGGNSGSSVIDLGTHQVVGLHFGGRYLEGNYAVALWHLTQDPLLKKAKINFV